MTTIGMRSRSATIAFLLVAAGCSNLLEVTNPGGVQDEALNAENAVPALVTGMSGDLSVALARTTWWGSVWSDELTHSGTLGAPSVFARGVIPADEINQWWAAAHRARWVAENGTERIKDVLGGSYDQSMPAARANLLAGFANRLLGEHVCAAVLNGGPEEPFSVHFTRAEAHFTEALRIAENIGNSTLSQAARGGRASVRAALGDWAGAVSDAAQVPANFRYDAIYSLNTARENNEWVGVTRTRGEYTVWGTQWAELADDRRLPSEPVLNAEGQLAMGANGQTPWIRQAKYLTDANPIALTRGTEMLLIRAEAALREGRRESALELINEGRAVAELPPAAATDDAGAWSLLRLERGAVLWLEARRFWDLRRWYEASGPSHASFLEGRDRCVPIGTDERASNANL